MPVPLQESKSSNADTGCLLFAYHLLGFGSSELGKETCSLLKTTLNTKTYSLDRETMTVLG